MSEVPYVKPRTTSDQKAEADRLLEQGNQQYATSQFQSALQSWQQALIVYQQIKDRKGESVSLIGLGNAYESLGQYQKAIDFFQQSLAITKQIKDLNGESNSLIGLGNAYYRLGQYQRAINFFQQSLAITKQIKDLNGESASLNNLGNAYYRLGQYQRAIDFFQQSLAITKQIGNLNGESASLNNLGNAYESLGQYQRAIDFFQQSLTIKKQIGNLEGESNSLNNLGDAYERLGQYQRAIDFFQQSLTIKRQIGDLGGESNSLNNLGIAYKSLKQYQRAIDFFQQSLAIKKRIGDRKGESNSLNNLGNAYDILGQYQKAINFSQQSLAIKKQIGDRNGEGLLLINMGVTFNKLNQTEIAILFYKESVNVRESIRKDIKKLSKEEQKSYLSTVEEDYRNLGDLLLQQNRIIEALQVLDLLKVQELEDYLKNIKGSDRSTQGVRLLAPELAISNKLLAVNFDNSQDINNQLANQIQQLPKAEINKVPDYLNQIPNGTVLLYPFILSDRLEIILFSPNNLPIRRTTRISKDQLETLISDFRAGLLDAGSEDFREPSIQLYNLLIKPIETELAQFNAKTILYAPDGQLRYIPIAALYDGKQWLVEKYQISNLIAYTLFDFSSQPKNVPNILAGAFGGKAGDRKFGQTALPATVREVQAIANSFQNSVTLIEEQFSRQAIESKFKNHNILHLATHAEFNSGAPDNSFIIFGNGDKIRLNEITDWQIPNIDLIILSACQTGVGKLGSGVEILGFGYQVQKAGAKQAIASLWSVNDEGTQALMEAFYDELKKGDVSSTEALHRAQVALIKSKKYNHPNYWSAFFAIGNGL
ncbi:MAG: CHAT domain-containing protein [Pseudanabaena sp.]